MPSFFDYDPVTGVTEYFDYDPMTGMASVHSTVDAQAYVDRVAETRNSGAAEKGLMEKGKEFHLYAVLSPIMLLEMRAKGIDVYSTDPAMNKKMFDEINANYPKAKVTMRTHR